MKFSRVNMPQKKSQKSSWKTYKLLWVEMTSSWSMHNANCCTFTHQQQESLKHITDSRLMQTSLGLLLPVFPYLDCCRQAPYINKVPLKEGQFCIKPCLASMYPPCSIQIS
jgi:hypothetical protein